MVEGAIGELGPFELLADFDLGPEPELSFRCPVSNRPVAWAAKDLFNPGAVVHDGRVHLLVRAEDHDGPYAGVSRIGLAVSDDGVRFALEPEPVIFPADDAWKSLEWPGGCEDPRVVESPDGGFVCTYTAFAGTRGILCVATSADLRHWAKHGPVFADTPYATRSSKSGAVLTEVVDGRLVATRRDGRFWMYWGEGVCCAATSTDLVHWSPVEYDATGDRALAYETDAPGSGDGAWRVERTPGQKVLRPILFPRRGRFDSLLVEPGPPAIVTDGGIVLLYNGANDPAHGDATRPAFSYAPGQAHFDPTDPSACIGRTTRPFLELPDRDALGQVDNVCFVQGLVLFAGQWLQYFGRADSRIGAATASLR